MAVINTNISATIAQNSLVKNERMMSKAMEQLSTGRKINSAADDAAGIAISSRMTAQVQGLSKAIQNASDASSLLQVADGAYAEVENMLLRMRELAVQANSDTISDTDRGYMNTEFSALAAQIQAVGNNTEWNGAKLLDGSYASSGTATFQIGAQSNAVMTHTLTSINGAGTDAFITGVTDGSDNASASQPGVAGASVTKVGFNLDDLDNNSANGAAETLSINVNGTDYTLVINSSGGDNALVSVTAADGTVGATQTPALNVNSGDIVFSIDTTGDDTLLITAANQGALTINASRLTYTSTTGATGLYQDIDSISVTSRTNAVAALTTLDTALGTVRTARATTGADMNRLESAIDVLSAEASNTEASLSRVQDTDYATATTELARTQIIQQAGTAMLAQANQLPQTVLSLLQ
jgi:flagellin